MSLKPYSWRQAIMKSKLPATTKLVLYGVSMHVNDAGQAACVSTACLAKETSLSERAVISHLKAVENSWVWVRRHGYGDKRWAANEYLPRLPDDPSLDVQGTEPPSVPPAEIAGNGTERRSAPKVPEGTERHDTKALNVVQGDIGFDLKHYPPLPPQTSDLLGEPEAELLTWFESEFWTRYPRRVAKARAWRIVRRLKPDAKVRAAIAASVAAMAAHAERDGTAPKFIPYPASWLNDRRWSDEVPRGTSTPDDRCATCGGPGVISHGKRMYCREHNPLSFRTTTTEGEPAR